MKLRKVPKLLRDKGGVSAVISNVILIGAVIAIGFSVMAWTYSQSSVYQAQYENSVNSDINKLRERVSFEYVFYNNTAKSLSVYLMNSGQVSDVSFTTIYISNSSWRITFTSVQFTLKFMNGTSTTYLAMGLEGYFALSSVSLQSGNAYAIKVVTWRGSSFENSFVA